jgi:hypothetical protein
VFFRIWNLASKTLIYFTLWAFYERSTFIDKKQIVAACVDTIPHVFGSGSAGIQGFGIPQFLLF